MKSMKGRNKLWISGVLVLVGAFLIRTSFPVLHRGIEMALMAMGAIAIISGVVMFFTSFRE